MLQRAAVAPPRGPRGPSPSVRGGGRGGIQKRRGGTPARIDKDGDLVMDAGAAGDKRRAGRGRIEGGAPSKPLGSGRTNSGPGRGGNQGLLRAQQAIMRGMESKQANILESRITTGGTTLRIDGLSSSKAASNPDGGLESLLGFLERKASGLDSKSNRPIKIKKSSMKGDSVIITASSEDIAQIQKLDKFSFAGSVLSIQACDPPSPQAKKSGEKEPTVSQAAQEAKDRFRAILAARYDADLKLLNLSALALDAGLRQMGVFDGSTTTSKVFPAMMVVCDGLFKSPQEKRDAIVSVSLADNELADVSAVTTLAQTFPDLKNLDLSRNKFTDIKNLNAWRWKFRHLENLVLTGNPIESQPTLKDELLRRYPNLQIVNGVTLRTPEEIAAAKAIAEVTKSPIPIAGPDFRDVSQVGENFIRQFLPLYDNDRNALLGTFYDSQSVYSLSLNLTSPRSHEHSVPIAPWTAYIKYSRNLTKLTHLNARMSRQHKGSQAIQQVWSALPPSRHPELESHADKYLIECHPIPGLTDPSGQSARGVDGLIITMHGEFEDQIETATEKSLRSFSRTFILGPGAPGGPPIRVVSDMLTLRAWAPLALPQISSISPETQAMNDPEQQKREAITVQLVEKTGMTPYYANLCLTETGWDIEQAFIAFTANKDKLPADAFMPGVAR